MDRKATYHVVTITLDLSTQTPLKGLEKPEISDPNDLPLLYISVSIQSLTSWTTTLKLQYTILGIITLIGPRYSSHTSRLENLPNPTAPTRDNDPPSIHSNE